MHFAVHINAAKEKVWNALWEDTSYRNWTDAFAEGSHAVTDNWMQGTKVLFLDGKGKGMASCTGQIEETCRRKIGLHTTGDIIKQQRLLQVFAKDVGILIFNNLKLIVCGRSV